MHRIGQEKRSLFSCCITDVNSLQARRHSTFSASGEQYGVWPAQRKNVPLSEPPCTPGVGLSTGTSVDGPTCARMYRSTPQACCSTGR